MQTLDLIVFVLYMGGITLFGVSFYSQDKSASAFTLGNSNFPAWVVTMSIFATFVSSISFLGLPGNAYQSNWNSFVFSLSIPVASVMAVQFFVPIYRKLNSPSAYSYLETKFGLWARVYVSACYLLTQLMRIGTILYLLALPVNALFGWDILIIIAITGLVVMIYSLLGGIQAVMWTDAIQGVVLIGGALICLIYIAFRMPEGPGQIIDIAQQHNKFSLGSFGTSPSESTFWVVLIYGIFINLQNYGIDQNYVQRYMASRSDAEAKRSALWGGMLYVPVSLLFFMIGTSLFAYYQVFPDTLPVDLQDPAKGDRVFPFFIVDVLPAGLTGLLIASIFAAGMSTISTSINSSSTVLLVDYFQRFSTKYSSEKQSMRVLYLTSFVISVLGIGIAFAMINVKSALDAWWKLASVFSGGMLGLFLLGAFVEKVNRRGTILGVALGVILILWMSLSPLLWTSGPMQAYASPFHAYQSIVFGTMILFITGFLVTLVARRR
ncbi:sodium:solute symporter [Arundinibacter roseus]|uniref:Sodium:solute symporter n=1 Tax=Arundinibacter roseus TaxID=2070510 RepID=A0A4V2X8Z3_9BACT|nr:sodium:solute symporter [Arundinibacter roseus]TDB61785.1 sodium:solute symporter [Arundinibacter roseus]